MPAQGDLVRSPSSFRSIQAFHSMESKFTVSVASLLSPSVLPDGISCRGLLSQCRRLGPAGPTGWIITLDLCMAVSSPTSRAVCPRSHVASGGCPHLLLWLISLSHSTMSSCQSQACSTSSPLYRPVIPTEPAGTSPNAGPLLSATCPSAISAPLSPPLIRLG